ncbi:recombinase [Mycobacteroides abscessus subsp. abscessus]|uniref:recombinase family protein n=1 Tax=Mycobacteroides abscessus TaxID=36809 RepID=UPI00092BDC6D|nr:recombinase family protein [Mycobacteroides abscessus]SHT46736.1 recombinase [Mycobacteroides abscessus subsp. abscessus]SHW33003.1 recombinase [Mycobacteroides abscessus subsp. abscessus]SIF91629.1 recombinase [Mycobacteroides abscessus subsp. abscessus]SKD17754.1 recombinase [Mycobacteroides abscessus subsp. abscessus]SKM23121.1 recombinase [Mycobacteroides abscessus subsp. abscessus]
MGAEQERAVLYARISYDRRGEQVGVTRQLEAMRKLAERQGWLVVDEIAENDISATKGLHRPGYDRVWALVTAGQVDHVVVWQSSRLMRSRKDRAAVIETFGRHRVDVVAVEGPSLDLRSAYGRGVADLLTSFDSLEGEVKAERVAEALADLKQRGKPWGLTPYGWDRSGGGYDAEQTINQHEAEVVRELVDRLLAGESLNELYRDMNARGEPAPGWVVWHKRSPESREASLRKGRSEPTKLWAKSTIRTLVSRDINAGIRDRRDDDTTITGDWPPIVDPEKHELVRALLTASTVNVTRSGRTWQQARRSHSGPRPGARKHLLTNGIGRCGVCGDLLRVAKRSGRKTIQTIYMCRGVGCTGRVQENVDNLVSTVVIARLQRPDALDWLMGDEQEVRRLDNRCVELQARLDDAADMFAVGKITASQLDRITAGVMPDLEAAQRDRDAAVGATDLAAVRPLAGAKAEARWGELSVAQRRAVLETMGVEVVLMPRKLHGPGFEADTVRISMGGVQVWPSKPL